MNNIKIIIAFISGILTGAAGGILLLKNHYEQIANDEIESVKDTFKERKTDNIEIMNAAEPNSLNDIQIKNKKPTLNDYMNKLKEEGYKNYSNAAEPNKTVPVEPNFSSKDIYTISDAEFGEEDEYEIISLTYFHDNVLCDENNEPLSQNDILRTVGYDSLENFDYEAIDAVYVRNDILKTDYEILRDLREYKNVIEDRM